MTGEGRRDGTVARDHGIVTVLVTGASGFVGRHVCTGLLRRGYAVRALVRVPGRVAWPDGLSEVVGSLSDQVALRTAADRVDAVVHLAGRAHVTDRDHAESVRHFNEVNDAGTGHVIRAAAEAGVGRFVHMSSIAAVCTSARTPVSENAAATPSTPYGLSKLASERTVRLECDQAGISHLILRPPMIYGPHMRGNPLRLFDLIAGGWPVPVCREPNRRSVLFVENFVSIVDHLLSLSANPSDTFHLSDPGVVSTLELVRMIAAALGQAPRTAPLPAFAPRLGIWLEAHLSKFARPRLGGLLERVCGSLELDTRHLAEVTGFAAPFSTAAGIELTAQWYGTRGKHE